MASFQKVIFMGHLGRDPEARYFGDGSATCTLSIGSSESWKDRNTGERKERTTWVQAKCFGRTAEIATEYLRKGSPVMIEGKLQNEEWEDKKTGEKRYGMSVRVDRLVLMGSRGEGGERREESREESRSESQQTVFEDDIPF